MKKYMCMFLLVIGFCTIFVSISAFAADEIKIIDFKKVVVDTDDENTDVPDLSGYYGPGTIDVISGKYIVIDDLARDLSSELIVKNLKGETLELYQVKQGMTVYYDSDSNNYITKMIVK